MQIDLNSQWHFIPFYLVQVYLNLQGTGLLTFGELSVSETQD